MPCSPATDVRHQAAYPARRAQREEELVSDIADVVDRFEIERLQAECIDALMMHD